MAGIKTTALGRNQETDKLNPLFEIKNESRTKMALMAAENLLAVLKGEIPSNCLNCSSL
jgi:hypothetical protein